MIFNFLSSDPQVPFGTRAGLAPWQRNISGPRVFSVHVRESR